MVHSRGHVVVVGFPPKNYSVCIRDIGSKPLTCAEELVAGCKRALPCRLSRAATSLNSAATSLNSAATSLNSAATSLRTRISWKITPGFSQSLGFWARCSCASWPSGVLSRPSETSRVLLTLMKPGHAWHHLAGVADGSLLVMMKHSIHSCQCDN